MRLFITHNFSQTRIINIPIAEAQEFLHDPIAFLRLNGLIISVSESPSSIPEGTRTFVVVEKLALFWGIETRTTFTASFTPRADGVDFDVVAGAGTRVFTKYSVSSGGHGVQGQTEVNENVTLKAFFLFAPFIIRTLERAHRAHLKKLADHLERRLGVKATYAPVPKQDGNPLITIAKIVPLVTLSVLVVYYLTYHDFFSIVDTNRTLAVIIVGTVLILAVSHLLKNSTGDPYGLFHLSLNRLPGEIPDAPPRTEWLNMGFWKDTDVFPEACEALALKLVLAAKCKDGGRVFDVGHGTGESLILLLSHPSIPRPSHITGITSIPTHHKRSQDRVTRCLEQSQPKIEVSVSLQAGDAIYRPAAHEHPLDPHASDETRFDTILALDCAYHFDSRALFLRQAFDRLAPGGRVALADICFEPSALLKLRAWLIVSVLRMMPKENRVSTEEYIASMRRMGYVDVDMRDVTADVFPGFIKFLKGRGLGWWVFSKILEVYTSAGARFVIVSGMRQN